ncbi:MAG: rhodanese-like domain-containing protein [Devosiaceae bacterium]
MASVSNTQSIDPDQLVKRMQSGSALQIFDVRRAVAFAENPRMIDGASRLVPWNLPGALEQLRFAGRERYQLVMVCVYGHAVSQTACTIARCHGFYAVFLAGGLEGWTARGYPTFGQANSADKGYQA